jgi:hypothetical protein
MAAVVGKTAILLATGIFGDVRSLTSMLVFLHRSMVEIV